ncbi:MAG: hypothetical protein N2Z82_00695 [Thermomicrobium sp.]|nr:hypothetical protein [Thermomicrobium sp.]
MHPEEAAAALSTISETERAVRRASLRWTLAPTLVTWGIVWIAGYLGSLVLEPSRGTTLWTVLVAAGIAIPFGTNTWYGRRVRSPFGRKLALSWMVAMFYLFLWSFLLFPRDPILASFFLVTAIMAGYVLMGIWLTRPLAVIGGFVTTVALLGYLAGPLAFVLAVGLAGGGALVLGGLWLWRSA